jgi:hypothetical protein
MPESGLHPMRDDRRGCAAELARQIGTRGPDGLAYSKRGAGPAPVPQPTIATKRQAAAAPKRSATAANSAAAAMAAALGLDPSDIGGDLPALLGTEPIAQAIVR